MADQDYDMGPTTEMMVNDFDDERTLDEEEALEGSEDSHNELSNLQKEGDMPLKDLLAMYGYGDPSTENSNSSDRILPSTGCDDEVDGQSSDKGEGDGDADIDGDGDGDADDDEEDVDRTSNEPDLKQFYTEMVKAEEAGTIDRDGIGSGSGGSSRLLRSVSRPQSEEEEDDCDYSPDEDEWKKTIMVGSDYQAAIPEGLCRYDDALPYENEDKMLWDPSHIAEEETEEFLERAQLAAVKGNTIPAGSHVRDDEQALYLLLQCGYNLEEALRRRRMNVIPSTDAVSLWSEEECHNFETGLRTHGKDFHRIQKYKVRTRSVGELVQFYYLWKKTERHDIFTYKARIDKKKYSLHPGITDYMDRFLEEQEGVRDRSSSPNNHYLHHSDSKRQRSSLSTGINEMDTKQVVDSWSSSGAVDPLRDPSNSLPQVTTANTFTTTTTPPTTTVTVTLTATTTTVTTTTTTTTITTTSTSSSGNSRHTEYTSHAIHEGPVEERTSRPHATNNHGTIQDEAMVESNNLSSPENILPHLPP
ncbi:mesoderm induction early response protein 1-like isoform X2 [Athalia rosae]|uniref:mesoderm induction early response protein 1-like isoform X2 n=1 Tax=Athalia rosae TaxID=37344 RepID=UPI0020338086|nr:mesoderm induction early response protein 1-like isoform X2 [Athalia rosae]